jgi:steroid 5-alpha reductase family enzyme
MTIFFMVFVGWAFAAALMWLVFLLQRRLGDSGVVDIAWSAGVGVLGVAFALLADGDFTRRMILIGVVTIWSLRLAIFILNRLLKFPEDGRYLTLKAEWGDQASSKMFRFYQMQAIGVVLFALPVLIAAHNPQPWNWLDVLGALIACVAIVGESLADIQLSRFRKNPVNKGKVCQDGLWYYSRHPNYFFEWLYWWAYVLIAISYPWGWLTLIGPAAMWYFITQVTGIPPTEAQAIKSRGESYRQYQRTTNAFFPGPRKLQLD